MLSKFQARAFFLGGTAVFTGIFLILTIDTHRQVPAQTNADQIDDHVRAGKKLWEANNCMGCHTLFGEGAYYAPELTKVVDRRGADWIRVFMKDPEAMFPGQRKMVKYDFGEQQIDDIIAFLDWCGKVDLNGFPADPPLQKLMQPPAGLEASASGELPASVAAAVPLPPMFEQKSCTGCHRILGKGMPGVMMPNSVTGEVVPAPALDLVFQRKTREELIEWITDPQKVVPGSPMPNLVPALVSPEEVVQMVDFLMGLEAHATPR